MKNIQFPLLSKDESSILNDALHYMKMAQLKKACSVLSLSDNGKKADLIKHIMEFISTGQRMDLPTIPPQSLAKNYPRQPLDASGLMLYGSYKNDDRTRSLFKKLVGPSFHFTAFGIDWLNERWLQGKPPTYQEFALYWIEETSYRKHHKAEPKKEWAYIRFLQNMSEVKPDALKDDLMKAWKQLQAEKAQQVQELLEKVVKKIDA